MKKNALKLLGASCVVAGTTLAYKTMTKSTKADFSPLLGQISPNSTGVTEPGGNLGEMPDPYDYIVCGSGPGAAAWLRTTLKSRPDARILLLERGPYCKTDILTESNPIRCLIDSMRTVADYNHGVMQVTKLFSTL